jgi:hypothetical protein
MDIKKIYNETIKKEVEIFSNIVNKTIENNLEIKDLNKGWRVFYSPLKFQPEILFIGINPGAGMEGIDLDYFEDDLPIEFLAYESENGNLIESTYNLASQTKALFAMAGKLSALENSVKTNYFYLTTSREKDLYIITEFLGRNINSKENLGNLLFDNSFKWTMQLIELIKPKLIICEGNQAYKNVGNMLSTKYNGANGIENNEFSYWEYPKLNTAILGYKRNFSNIKNKEAIAEFLKTIL